MRQLAGTAWSLVVLLLPGLSRADWITGGGNPRRSGISSVPGPAARDILWQGSIASSFGQQVFVWNDKLVTYRDNFNTSILICHNLTTGETLWTHDFPGTPGDRSLPVGFRDNTVHVVDLRNAGPDTLYAFNGDDGSIVWKSPHPVSAYISESVCFADNGDLVFALEGMRSARIDHLTGDTVWTTPRVWPVSGSADITVSGTSWYCFGGALVGGALRVYAFDLATGHKRESVWVEDTHPGGSAPYGNIIVGPDGVLYAHRCADNVAAIEDHDDSLHVRWVHEVSSESAALWAQLACGPDSSVYCFSSGRVVRLDPRTGLPRDSSIFVKDPTAVFAAHLAVGADGTVYCANGGYACGALFAFTPDLQLIWVDSVPNVSTSNPALSRNGELAIAGGGTALKVYRSTSSTTDCQPAVTASPSVVASPNPFRTGTVIAVTQSAVRNPQSAITIHDVAGRLVRKLQTPGPELQAPSSLTWDGTDDSGRRLAAGVYLCRISSGTGDTTLPLTLTR